MEQFRALMSKKVAGIPVLWIALAIAVVALYGALRLKPAPEESDDEPEGDEDTSGDIGDTSQPVFSATPVIMQPSGPSVASTPMEDTNDLWGRRAIEWLVANGHSLTLATTAITKYLAGETLSSTEGGARDKAVKQFGLPPEGLTPTSTAATPSPPASKQGTTPLWHTVRGQRDNTPGELARLYYGIANGDAIEIIRARNTTLTEPYRVGLKVRVPEYRDPKFYRSTAAVNTLYEIARKNGTTPQSVTALNPGMKFPVKAGTSVRIR